MPGPFDLSVNILGNGAVTSIPTGIHCPPDCKESYAENTSVQLRAVPAQEAVFGGWSDASCKPREVCTVKMDRNTRVGVIFGKEGGVPGASLLLMK